MDVLAPPPPLGRVMQTASASLRRHPLLMDGGSPANFRRGSLQAGNEIRAPHVICFHLATAPPPACWCPPPPPSPSLPSSNLPLLIFLVLLLFIFILLLFFSVHLELLFTCWDPPLHSVPALQLFLFILLRPVSSRSRRWATTRRSECRMQHRYL